MKMNTIKAIVLDEYAKVTLETYRKLKDRLFKIGAVPKELWTTEKK